MKIVSQIQQRTTDTIACFFNKSRKQPILNTLQFKVVNGNDSGKHSCLMDNLLVLFMSLRERFNVQCTKSIYN